MVAYTRSTDAVGVGGNVGLIISVNWQGSHDKHIPYAHDTVKKLFAMHHRVGIRSPTAYCACEM